MSRFTWKIGGEAGFGIMTTGLTFAKIASRQGFHLFDYVEYPSLIRGGHNAYEVVFGDEKASALKKEIDFLICLNEETYKLHKNRLCPSSLVVYNLDEFSLDPEHVGLAVPFDKILQEGKGEAVMKNMIALGASIAILGVELDRLRSLVGEQFGKKGEAVVKGNNRFAEAGYKYVKDNYPKHIKNILGKKNSDQKLVMTGNDAFSLGAVIADCRLYAAYPMTPASSVLATLASWQDKTGMIVRHPEDEIAAIMTVVGASFAGVRSACGTSGGGFALKVESISFAGVSETPAVIFLAQRPGPATGMPTWTEAGDLLFAVHAGHGEFPKIVLAPGDVEEMIKLTAKAFDLADIYQLPVIIMSDMYLSESHQTITKTVLDQFINGYRTNRGKTVTSPSGGNQYLRYRLNDDGISERLIPGAKGFFYQANSYEHLEDSHSADNPEERNKQVEKRKRKEQTYLAEDFQTPQVYGNVNEAEMVFVSWGSTKGVLLETQKILKEKSVKTAIIHFTHLYPLEAGKVKALFVPGKRYVLVENNSQGQFGKLLRMETGIEIKDKLLKYDGRPFMPEEILIKLIA
jgi:2-oxoglutarate ferredoxin oxidoreductase subunit alpha